MKIAVIGHGFVGKAVDYGFSNADVEKKILDPIYGTTREDVKKLKAWRPNLTFVCVPTPMKNDGDIDTSILDEVMTDLFQKPYPARAAYEVSKLPKNSSIEIETIAVKIL